MSGLRGGWKGVVWSAALVAGVASAADGDLDTTFRDGGSWVYTVSTVGAKRAAVGFDGRLLIGYTAALSGTDTDMRLVPVPDQGVATLCGSYQPDLGGTNEDWLNDMAVDGTRVYLAGRVAGPVGDPDSQLGVAAVNLTNCQIDPAFGGGDGYLWPTTVPLEAAAISLSMTGEPRLATQYDEGGARHLYSFGLDTVAGVDPDFEQESVDFITAFGAEFFEPRGSARQPDGKILVVGTMELPDGDRDVGLARFEADGDLDLTFSLDGLAGFSYGIIDSGDDEGNAVAVLADGRIVVVGSVDASTEVKAAVAVLTPTGGFFNDFGVVGRYSFAFGAGVFRSDSIGAVKTQGDGKIVVVGSGAAGPSPTDFHVARLLATGDTPLDPAFSGDGLRSFAFNEGGTFNDRATDLTLGQGGRITVVGSVSTDTGLAIGAIRLENDYIFADGFEMGRKESWIYTD